ncbi:hypothetical protein [Nocardia noduli]|uniref:hypothetical protein n=1 Tax=Nocardia noduli TaxID=2815722 RepID=UPI001C24F655|nr:hypothetical protein [Nocardia noduli]
MHPNSGDIDPITSQMHAVRQALMVDQATVGRYGVAVDVSADGTLQAVRIDESVTPHGVALGSLITKLAQEALEQARVIVRERIDNLCADPRIAAAVESIEIASERPYLVPSAKQSAPIPDDDLTEEELIELNQRRNASFFRNA